MSTILEIENAIERLVPTERAKLAAWLARKEAQDWDAQMDADAGSGKLDFMFEEAHVGSHCESGDTSERDALLAKIAEAKKGE